jgi:DNA-binding NtrC family response regulator
MTDRMHKILLVEPDPSTMELLVAALSRRFHAHITCVSRASSGLHSDAREPNDLVIAEMKLPDASGLEFAEQLLAGASRPVILIDERASSRRAVAALRLGIADLFHKPFPVECLLQAAQEALDSLDFRRRTAVRHRRMREMVRRMIRERRDLNRRVELVCKDLVDAQRRLSHRVLALEARTAQAET